jgi:tetratricopeptide (TPR) repeat protein
MKKIIPAFLLCSIICKAQINNVDSLKQILTTDCPDSTKVTVLRALGYYYWERNPDSSIYFSQQLIALGNKKNIDEAIAHGYSRMGRALNNKGNYSKGMEYLLVGLRKFEQIKDSAWIANSYNHLGNVNKGVGKLELAIRYYKICLEIAERIRSIDNQMFASMNLGLTYETKNNLDSALYFAQRAYQLNRKLANEAELDVIFSSLGSIYSKLNEQQVAKTYFNRAIEIAVRDKDMKPASVAYFELAKLYLNQNQLDSAQVFARASYRAAVQSSYLNSVLASSRLIAEVFEKRKKFDSAFYYQKVSMDAKDSLVNNEKARQVEALNFNEEARQKELTAQEEKEAEERKMNLQYGAIAIGLITAVMVFLALSRTIIAGTKTIEIIGMIALLFVFEFINLLIHPFIGNITHHSPLLMLLIMVCIAGMLVPAHHHLEKWVIHKLIEKNKNIRLAAAKKTISKLEGNTGFNE